MTAWQVLREAPRRIGEAAEQARPALRAVVSPPQRMGRRPFALLIVVLVMAGMVGLLLLNTQLQNQAFAVRDAQRAASELGYRVSDLESQVTRAQSPVNLARMASGLGMVPNPYAVFIDLTTGTVVGEPRAVTGEEIPSLHQQANPAVPDVGKGAPAARPATPPAPADAVPPADQPGQVPDEPDATAGEPSPGTQVSPVPTRTDPQGARPTPTPIPGVTP